MFVCLYVCMCVCVHLYVCACVCSQMDKLKIAKTQMNSVIRRVTAKSFFSKPCIYLKSKHFINYRSIVSACKPIYFKTCFRNADIISNA